jgi:hypothetical protein
MREKLVDKIALDNGLTLELWDRSRQVAGDRWLVCFVARSHHRSCRAGIF